jgi:hypothetical protein
VLLKLFKHIIMIKHIVLSEIPFPLLKNSINSRKEMELLNRYLDLFFHMNAIILPTSVCSRHIFQMSSLFSEFTHLIIIDLHLLLMYILHRDSSEYFLCDVKCMISYIEIWNISKSFIRLLIFWILNPYGIYVK